LDDGGKQIVLREARLPFGRDRIILLRMNLLRRCLYVLCDPGKTCIDGACEKIDVDESDKLDPHEVDPYLPLEASVPFDLGPDRGPVLDGGVDGPLPDQAVDGPEPDTLPNICKPDPTCPGGLCPIPHGSFYIGSLPSENCREGDEDYHKVILTRCFEIQRTEVTQQAFEQEMGYNNAGHTSCGSCPIENVTWHEAAAYCNELTEKLKPGLPKCYSCGGSPISCIVEPKYDSTTLTLYDCPGYRLPTEAEWEYAARAGETKALYNGFEVQSANCDGCDPNVDPIAWYSCNSKGTTQPVGQRTPNAWGLHDTAGNVAEWSSDMLVPSWGAKDRTDPWWSTKNTPYLPPYLFTYRGGCWDLSARKARSANRGARWWNMPLNSIGFRCVRSLTGTTP
jgi:formylglycine-generating enzyme required for sulfatase activity